MLVISECIKVWMVGCEFNSLSLCLSFSLSLSFLFFHWNIISLPCESLFRMNVLNNLACNIAMPCKIQFRMIIKN